MDDTKVKTEMKKRKGLCGHSFSVKCALLLPHVERNTDVLFTHAHADCGLKLTSGI